MADALGPAPLAVSYPVQNGPRAETRNSRTELVYQIPGLPPMPTDNVEGLPQIRPGQNIPLTNEEWFAWVPDALRHCREARTRTETPSRQRNAFRTEENRRVAADERYWFNTYAAIFESRGAEDEGEQLDSEEATDIIGATGLSPFILYPFQDYWLTWHAQALRWKGSRGDTITLKSRDMGASNTAVGAMAYRWMVRRNYQGRLLSRNEELVDASGDPDALFWKLDTMLRSTPRWMLDHFVPGFNWSKHRRHLVLEHPTRQNLLKGESTSASAGRGKRAFEIMLDEFTVMQNLRAIWTATRASSPHRTAVGTVSTSKGLDAYNLYMRRGAAIIELDSRTGMHPRQDAAWHAYERERDTEAGYRQEVGMDWFADSSDFVYPEAHTKTPGDFPYQPFAGPVFVAIDDGNHWAMWWIQYIRSSGRFHVLDAYRNSGRRTAFYGGLMRGLALGDFRYGPHEERILKLARDLPIAHFIGDTHGAHREQIAGMSVYEDLALNWNITVNIDYMENQYVDRKKKTEDLIPLMDFNATPGVIDGLQALKMYRFRATPEGKEVAREVREPLHNDDSHYATALERFCTQFDQFKWVYAGAQPVYEGEYSR